MSNKPRNFKKFWNVATDQGNGTGTIDLTGEIIDIRDKEWLEQVTVGNYYTSADFAADIAACNGLKEVTVNINSPGGDLFMGIAIHNALRGLNCKVTTVIQGIAASAASIIFCAGDNRLVYPGSVLMVHGVSSFIDYLGYYNEHGITEMIAELKQLKKAQGVMNGAIADIYSGVTGKTREECQALIGDNGELYMTGADAIERGFATGYADGCSPAPLKMVACAGKTALYSGEKLLTQDFHAPQNALALGITTADSPATNKEENTMNENENKPATVDMLTREQALEAQQNAVKAAMAADRKRIADIDAIAAKWGDAIDNELVNKAKYGASDAEPMTVEQFALAAMNGIDPAKLTAAKQGAAHINARAGELEQNNKVPTASANPVEAYADGADRNAQGVRKDILAALDRVAPVEK